MLRLSDKEEIDLFYKIDATNTLMELLLSIKYRYPDTSEDVKKVIIDKITELKSIGQWSDAMEQYTIKEFVKKLEKKEMINNLSPQEQLIYKNRKIETLKEYDFTLV